MTQPRLSFYLLFSFLLSLSIVSCSSSDDDTVSSTGTTGSSSTLAFAGSWAGDWNNTTFSSTGPLTLTIVDNGDDTVDITVDLDGFVGGFVNPDPQTITANVASDGTVSFSGNVETGTGIQSQLDFTMTPAGALTITMPDINLSGFGEFSASGTLSSGTADLTYSINFEPSGSANGTASATKS